MYYIASNYQTLSIQENNSIISFVYTLTIILFVYTLTSKSILIIQSMNHTINIFIWTIHNHDTEAHHSSQLYYSHKHLSYKSDYIKIHWFMYQTSTSPLDMGPVLVQRHMHIAYVQKQSKPRLTCTCCPLKPVLVHERLAVLLSSSLALLSSSLALQHQEYLNIQYLFLTWNQRLRLPILNNQWVITTK